MNTDESSSEPTGQAADNTTAPEHLPQWWDGAFYSVNVEQSRVLVHNDSGKIGEFKTREEACQFASRHWQLLWKYWEQMRLRDVSKIEFPHWWENSPETRAGLSVDEAKAALFYEAMRRHHEVQKAWLEGKFKFSFGEDGLQGFTTWVVNYLPLSWPELKHVFPIAADGVLSAMLSKLFVPPRGYSTFPESDKAKQRKASMQVLRLPQSDDPTEAQAFIKHARLFADAGFLIVAVDNKTNESVRCACDAVEKLDRSFRKADVVMETVGYLPPNISAEDRNVIEEKRRQKTLTDDDLSEMWRKYEPPTTSISGKWNQTGAHVPFVTDKRLHGGKLREEKKFHFDNICRELEAFDSGKRSDLIERLRL